MFKIYQVPDRLTNSLATIHESAYSRKIQILSSFMPSGQPDVVPKVLFTGRFPPTYGATQYKYLNRPVSPSLLINYSQGFPMRPEVQFEGKVGSNRKSESSAFAGKRSDENRTGVVRG